MWSGAEPLTGKINLDKDGIDLNRLNGKLHLNMIKSREGKL